MELDNNNEVPLRRPHGHSLASAVVSGDSDSALESSSSDDERESLIAPADQDIFENVGEYGTTRQDDDGGESEVLFRYNPRDPSHADDLYDQDLDEEDEAYVYRNLRGGIQERVLVRKNHDEGESKTESGNGESPPSKRSMEVLKPRNSDAVLSCPCCFNIVCMDCQRHIKYLNQFRAMFVMGIVVEWQSRLVYDEDQQLLVPKAQADHPNRIPEDLNEIGEKKEESIQYKEGEFFPVLCGNCRTQVAALDMIEEIYHFHGCLESS